MRLSDIKLNRGLLFAGGGILFLLMTMTTKAGAQAKPNSPQPTPGAVTNPEMHEREANITLLERGKEEAKSRDAALKQMNEDFQRIQAVDLDMMNVFSSGNPPDYKKISEDAADIRLRAIRLKNHLVLPPSVKDEKRKKGKDDDNTDLKSAMTGLDDSIKTFVGNPIFQQAQQPAGNQDIAKARLDLDEVIQLSSRIAKAAEKLYKEPGKSN